MYLEKFDLSGRKAFVTGGGRGIGLCAAEALLESGASVVLADRDPDVLEAGRIELANKGWTVDAVGLDVTDAAAVGRAAAEANARHGGIDILIANAGIAWPDTAGEAMADEVWHKVVDVNLNGVYWCCREFGRAMLDRGRGSIVTVGSMSGLISNKPQRQAHYNAAKAGVHHLTRSLAGEWAERGVRVYTVGFGTAEGASVNFDGWSIYMRFDEEALKAIADVTKVKYFHAKSAEDLVKVYESLNAQYVFERAHTEISALFAAAGALLTIVAAALSILWFQRIA